MPYYRHRLRQLQSLLEPGLRRMLLLSFILHLIIPVLLSGVLKATHRAPQLPVYRVNLINKPVLDPRSGRPDAVPEEKKPLVEPKPVAKEIPVKASKPVETKAVEKKTVPVKPAKPELKPDKTAEKAKKSVIEEMRAKLEREDAFNKLKARIAATEAELSKAAVKAPVGEPDGKGREIGPSTMRYIEAFIADQWRLSPYQSPLDLEAVVKVYYSKEGKQGAWEMVKKSGNSFFDDTVKRAIIRSKDLGQPLPVADEFTIIFNLKELQKR